jgi:hypothetical protein
MNIRWVIGITLWTFLSGPVFSGPKAPRPIRYSTTALVPVQKSSPATIMNYSVSVQTKSEKN